MIKCPNCGCENSDYSIYCSQCNTLLFSSDVKEEVKKEETISVPSKPEAKPEADVEKPTDKPEDKTEELRSEGFKYIPFEKDQQGSYTMDPSKANKPHSPEVEEDMANDRKYLLIYSIIGAVVFAIIVLVVILIGHI